jgi:hypothetical protein
MQNDVYLSKVALDSGCAYIPAGMNDKPLYIFSVRELTRFAELYKERYNLVEQYDKK